MTTLHFEPFVQLAGLTNDSALIAWGGFFFEQKDDGRWLIVEDPELEETVGGRRETIGVRSRTYGDALVEVLDADGHEVVSTGRTTDANHVWVRGLEPDTAYRYRITVDGQPWADGERCDWVDGDGDLIELERVGRRYDLRFRTHPAPDAPAALTFAVLGDYGVGLQASEGAGAEQLRVADALTRAVDHHDVRLLLTTGDNIYIGDHDTVAGTGEHDDDWYFSYYQPYRYLIARIPVYPTVGNHDADDSEKSDDRDQVADNFFTDLRFTQAAEVGRASVDPGMYYQFDFGSDVHFLCVDSTHASKSEYQHFFQRPEHLEFLRDALPEADGGRPPWRFPFCHHPPFCAGPHHGNLQPMVETLVPLYERAGVQLVLSGHEHNFQYSEHAGVRYLVTGAGGKLRSEPPTGFTEAHTVGWAAETHFLLVDVGEDEAVVHPVVDVDEDGSLRYLRINAPDGDGTVPTPIVVPR